MKKNITRIVIVLIIVGLLGGGYYFYTSFNQAREVQASFDNLETEVLKSGILETTISATGRVRSTQSTTLAWETTGTVETVNVDEKDVVKTGDMLATLEQTSLPQEIILAQASLEDYQTALEDLVSDAQNAKTKAVADIAAYTYDVRDAQYQLDNFTVPSNQAEMSTQEALGAMKANLDAAREAFEPYKYYPSTDDTREELKEALDDAQADYNSAVKRLQYETDLEVAQNNLQDALDDYDKWEEGPTEGEIASAEARVASAQAALSKAWIEAPFDGTITEIIPQAGDQVSLNSLAFRLDDLSNLYVDLEVSEVDINQVELRQEALITFDGIRNKEYHGEVVDIASIGSENSGVVDFTVTVQIIDVDEDVLPGMTAEVDIIVEQTEAALLVPNQAVRTNERGVQIVYIMETGGQMSEVEIKLGVSSDTQSEIVEGNLQAGDQVVLNPPSEEEEEFRPIGPMGGGGQQGGGMPNPHEMGGQ